MSDIKSDVERLRAASPQDRTAILEGILRDYSTNAVAKALCDNPQPSPNVASPGKARGGRPSSGD